MSLCFVASALEGLRIKFNHLYAHNTDFTNFNEILIRIAFEGKMDIRTFK